MILPDYVVFMGRQSDKHTIEGVTTRESKEAVPYLKYGFLVLLVAAVVVPFTDLGKKVLRTGLSAVRGKPRIEYKYKEKVVTVVGPETIVEVEIPAADLAEMPKETVKNAHDRVITEPVEDIRSLNSSGISLKTQFKADQSTKTASNQRGEGDAYEIEYQVKVKLPKPARTIEQLESINPSLTSMLPGLKNLVKKAKVSPYYFEIYKNKVDRIKRDAPKMKSLLSRHNFFDLQTVLNFESESGRKVMIMQADMDVVSDGSDGDRLATMPSKIVNSSYYQPFTSYGWRKQTQTPNPMMIGWQKRLKKARVEVAKSSTPAKRKKWLRERMTMLKRGISDMKSRSYLIAEHDPFIVIPVNMLKNMSDRYAPKVGDYAVVIYKEKLYPCIVGDGGPIFKVGEASLRLAKELNSRAGIYSRPVSDVSVTYLVFPFSRNAVKSAPDYAEWKSQCEVLLEEIGGLSPDYQLHNWSNTLPTQN